MTRTPSPSKSARKAGRKADAAMSPAISAVDLATLAGLPVLGLIAWLLPESAWHAIGRAFAPLAVAFEPAKTRRNLARIAGLPGASGLARPVAAFYRELVAGYFVENVQLLRAWRPGGWRPEIRVEGGAHLRAALAARRGVVLWVAHTSFGSLVSKMALDREGFAVSHLSHPRHGFSGTRFGRRFLNPVRTRIEAACLHERVVMRPENPVAAMRALRRRVGENGIVSFTAREAARKPARLPLLGGEVQLAPGAPDLAIATGAALLPVFCAREADGAYVVIVDAPVEPPADLAREEAAREMLAACADSLAGHLARWPGQWRGWVYLEDRDGESDGGTGA